MLDRGLTEDGAAQALGWPKSRVTARVKILELPERAQQLIGEDVIPLAAVDQLRAIGTVAPELLDAVIAYLDDGNAWAAERLTREPGWVLDAALTPRRRRQGVRRLPALRGRARDRRAAAGQEDRAALRGRREAAPAARPLRLRAAAGPLHRRRRRPGPRRRRADRVRRTARPIIVDRPLYRELVKAAIKRTHDDLEAKAAAAAKEKKTAPRRPGSPPTRVTAAKRERDAQLRELTDQAHGANLDLGHALIHNLTSRRPDRHRRRAVLRLRAARRRPRQLAVHADRGADRADRRRRHPARRRRAAHRRHQDAQGRQPRPAADRLRRPPRPAGRARVAVEVHRRRQDRGRALRPRAGRDRRRAVRQPPRRALQPAGPRNPLELAQGHRRQGAARSSPGRTSPRR